MVRHSAQGDTAAITADAPVPIIARPEGPDPTLDRLVAAALDLGQVQQARRLVAEGEAKGDLSPGAAALFKARIAAATGDFCAAQAILIAAIEAQPDHAAPRRALAEVMLAKGTAADARSVLAHLGPAPPESARPDPV